MRRVKMSGLVVIVGVLVFTSLSFGYTWSIQTVQDVSGKIEGSINSIAVSPVDGKFHVAYRAVSEAKLREGEGKAEPYTITDSVTGASGNYRWVSAAIGSNNVPWVTACNTWSGGSVTASYKSGSGFATETIATGTLFGSAIAVRSNNSPVVSYGTGADLKYAERTGANSWSISTVISGNGRYEDSQIALASTDSPYIAFRNDWNYNLMLAFKNGSSWSTETVTDDVMNSNADGSGTLDDDQYSKVLDIAVDPNDSPVIVYSDKSGHVQLKVRTAANTYSSYTVSTSGIARSVAVAINDADNKIYIAYNNVSAGDLLLASGDLTNLSAGFTTETVVSNSIDGINVQRYVDVAVQDNGLPVISFFQINSSPQMKLAVAVPEPATIGLISMGAVGFLRKKW